VCFLVETLVFRYQIRSLIKNRCRKTNAAKCFPLAMTPVCDKREGSARIRSKGLCSKHYLLNCPFSAYFPSLSPNKKSSTTFMSRYTLVVSYNVVDILSALQPPDCESISFLIIVKLESFPDQQNTQGNIVRKEHFISLSPATENECKLVFTRRYIGAHKPRFQDTFHIGISSVAAFTPQ